jgi:hypothetical protein
VAKSGERFAVLQPVYHAFADRWDRPQADIARSHQQRHD